MMDLQAFLCGESFDAQTFFGAHPVPQGGWIFRIYAPHAARVTLEGDFSRWVEVPPFRVHKGVYEFHHAQARAGQYYKYCVYSKRGVREERTDPYGFGMETPPKSASVLTDLRAFSWEDGDWMASRSLCHDRPLTIYELHPGTWLRHANGRTLTWQELADRLIPYLARFHFTHVELTPIGEHPTDGSWGYQCTGFFAPTARHGQPADFAAFVDALHRAGFGVIVDFVSVHFAPDRYGLRTLDGAALYESPRAGERRSEWGSFLFDHSRGPVRSFLQSAAAQWLETYHVDGLRFDAVSHLLYRQGRPDCGENTPGILFLQGMNRGLRQRFPTAMLMAEDSTLYPGTTRPLNEWGGLGFDYKWDMGWTHDALAYMQLPPSQRPGKPHLLTLGVRHGQEARWLLPFSHDDAAWKNLVGRMPGAEDSRLRQARLFLLFMVTHPGKKLVFMGTEHGMHGAWSLHHGPDWTLDEQPAWLGYGFFCEDLFRLAAENPALYTADEQPWAAQWLACDEGGSCLFALLRHSADHHVLAVMNFAAQRQTLALTLPGARGLTLLLHSDHIEYGGHTSAAAIPFAMAGERASFTLPHLSGMLLEVRYG